MRADVAVRQHHALRVAGRSARVVEVRDRVWIVVRLRRRRVLRICEQRVDGRGPRDACREPRRRAFELAFEHESLRLGVPQHGCHLAFGQPPVERHEDRVESRRGEVGDEVLRRVGEESADAVALRHAARVHRRGEPFDGGERVAVGDRAIVGDERRRVRSARRRVAEQGEQVHDWGRGF